MRFVVFTLFIFFSFPQFVLANDPCTQEKVCGMVGKLDHFSILNKCPNAGPMLVECTKSEGKTVEDLPEPEFVDNGDGTVTDKVNKLLWIQQGILEKVSYKDAHKYAKNAEIAGQKGWRIPTLSELKTLFVEYCPTCKVRNPSGKKAFIKEVFDDGVGHHYWTTTGCDEVSSVEDHYQKKICRDGDKAAWLVHFNIHALFWIHKDKPNYFIWLVKDL